MGFIQSASASNDLTGTSLAVTLGANVVTGNLLCIHCAHGGATDFVSSVVDTFTSTFAERKFAAGVNGSGSVWSGLAAGPDGSDTITMNLSATQLFRRVAVHEVSGFSTFDSANGQRNVPEPANSGNITPSVDGCYLFGCMQWDAGGDETIAAGTNVAWTLRENYQHANAPAATEDFTQVTATTVFATFTEGGAGTNVLCFIMAHQPSGIVVTPGIGGVWGMMSVAGTPSVPVSW